jgi:hypothetical protein
MVVSNYMIHTFPCRLPAAGAGHSALTLHQVGIRRGAHHGSSSAAAAAAAAGFPA